MRTRRQNVSADRLTITGPNKRLKTSTDEIGNSEPIPTDLVIEVLSRLPVKSLARIRCVSKPWASILLRPYFTELFLTRSSASPKLLFACQKTDTLFFFSSLQPQNPDENSTLVAANYHMSFQLDMFSSEVLPPVHGLICLKHQRIVKGKKEMVLEICNPSTGRSLTLPKVKTRRVRGSSFLGYDPVEKQFKLLSMTRSCVDSFSPSAEHQVLELGTGKLSWRKIECSIPHCPLCDGICIDGVLYYLARVGDSGLHYGIVCFDIKSEEFKFIEADNVLRVKLVKYKGKLATLKSDDWYGNKICGASTSFELAVLVDAEKHKWYYRTYVLPPLWKDIVADSDLSFVGVTRTSEILLSRKASNGFYLVYYNLERNTITKVDIQGMESSQYCRVHAFLEHVEDVKLWGSV